MISAKGVVGVSAAVGSWIAAYYFIINEIDKSSSLVNQSLFNINFNQKYDEIMKSPVQIASGIRGEMNQFKGLAEINFDVVDKVNSIALIIIKYTI